MAGDPALSVQMPTTRVRRCTRNARGGPLELAEGLRVDLFHLSNLPQKPHHRVHEELRRRVHGDVLLSIQHRQAAVGEDC